MGEAMSIRAGAAGVGCTLGLLLLSGCARQIVADQENLLAAAGFRVVPADTPAGAASLQSLPAQELVRTTRDGHPVWLYADAQFCRCLYVGEEPAYQNYARLRLQERIATLQVQAAQLNAMSWEGWGPWGRRGPWWW